MWPLEGDAQRWPPGGARQLPGLPKTYIPNPWIQIPVFLGLEFFQKV
ncbi:MAG: hypothetical protein XD51_0727 [Moorella sp. 60_41]|nr:MAG: hypothetical protein XD51_0727 [Moorella sp. 60_41]